MKVNYMENYSKSASVIYNFMLKSMQFSKYKPVALLWDRVWAKCCQRISSDIVTSIQGHRVLVNFGHPYPVISRQLYSFNNLLIEL